MFAEAPSHQSPKISHRLHRSSADFRLHRVLPNTNFKLQSSPRLRRLTHQSPTLRRSQTRRIRRISKWTPPSSGYLGSCSDEERTKMRYAIYHKILPTVRSGRVCLGPLINFFQSERVCLGVFYRKVSSGGLLLKDFLKWASQKIWQGERSDRDFKLDGKFSNRDCLLRIAKPQK